MHSDPFDVRECQEIVARQVGHIYVEPNRLDAEECDACFVVDGICDFHLGVTEGYAAAMSLVRTTLGEDLHG